MAATSIRRLPGFRFEAVTPPPVDVLPRMDVAGFVGFAASGPLHRPVRVESAAEFADIFGADTPLAWNPARGEMQYANLAPAVRAFFHNGGQRCWIVRVARSERALANHFPLPGLLQRMPDGSMLPAFAVARSEGSWSDDLRVSTALNSDALSLTVVSWPVLAFNVKLSSTAPLVPGDLIQATFPGTPFTAFLPVASVADRRIHASQATWFSTAPPISISGSGLAWTYTPGGPSRAIPALAAQTIDNRSITVDLALGSVDTIQPGTMLKIDFPGARLWIAAQSASVIQEAGSPPAEFVRVTGEGLWELNAPPSPLPVHADAQRLTFDLWVRNETAVLPMNDLGFVPGHPLFWGDLPLDPALYADPSSPLPAPALNDLWALAANPRFPLAGGSYGGSIFLPIGLAAVPDQNIPAVPQNGSALYRDGLALFDSTLFLDPKLGATYTTDLLAEADFIRYQSASPRTLQGMHALLGVDEVSMIAVPDAAQTGWLPVAPDAAPQPLNTNPIEAPVRRDLFSRCGIGSLAAPVLSCSGANSDGTFALSWTSVVGGDFELDEAESADYSDAATIFTGPSTGLSIFGKAHGDYFYRVRASKGAETSAWSNGVGVRVAVSTGYRIKPSYAADALLAVQSAVLRLCAARGDVFGILDLPLSYRESDSIALIASFKGTADPATFSYGGVYHPWLTGRDDTDSNWFRTIPPSGAACGILAKRANSRGTWVAPANELIAGVVDLEPEIPRERRLDLQQVQINIVRQESRGFLSLSADTLSNDADLRPINVRRLLMLLRRVALQRGARYVFEPDSDSFQRMVAKGFDAVMRDLFRRGAFAGATKGASYQVVTSSSVNSSQSMDEGRFIVELKVAPALPLTFMTVRLLETGDQKLFVEAR